MKRIILVVTIILAIGVFKDTYAQDPIFSQFYGNPIYLNPALAGAKVCPRVTMNYRNQWPGLDGTVYATYSASYDQYFKAISGGAAILAYHDIAGPGQLTTDQVSGVYNYNLNASRNLDINFAVQGTWFQKKIDWTQLTFGDQIDRRKGFVYDTKEVPITGNKSGWDFTSGFFAYSKKLASKNSFYAGAVVHHITEPNEGLLTISNLPMKITGHGGAKFPIGNHKDDVSISPNFLYQKQANYNQVNLGVFLQKGAFVSGLWYRNKDAFILIVGVESDNFKIGYSYDITVSKLTNKTAGAHELSMALTFGCGTPVKGHAPAECPHF